MQLTQKDNPDSDGEIPVSPEEILHQTGGCGRYQVLLSTIAHVMKCVICWGMVATAFITYVPNWRCADDDTENAMNVSRVTNSTGNTDSAVNVTMSWMAGTQVPNETFWNRRCTTMSGQKCSKFEYEPGIRTLSTEYDLICDHEWVKATITSVQMAGMCVGNVVAGQLGDFFGRKKPFLFSMVMLFAAHLVAYFTTGWVMYTVTRLIVGLGSAFFLTLVYNILSEYTLSKWRSFIIGIPTWAVEACLFALVAWLLHDWRYLTLVMALMAAAFLAVWSFVPEGFRWLMAHGRYDEAEEIVMNISRWNRHPAPDFHRVRESVSTDNDHSKKKYTLMELFRRKPLLKRIIPLTVCWLNMGMSTYGIRFGIQKLSGSIYLNMFLFSVSALPPKVAVIYIQNKWGRKATTVLSFCISGVGGLIVGIVQYIDTPHRDALTNGFAIMANVGVHAAWSSVQTMTVEVFPTVLRSTSFGFLSTMARFGAIIGPQLVYLNEMVPGIMYFVIAAISSLAVLGTIFLPETANKSLVDKLDDNLEIQREENTEMIHNKGISENSLHGDHAVWTRVDRKL